MVLRPNWAAPTNITAFSSLRGSGHSTGVYRGLNLGHHVGDAPDAVAANRQQLSTELPAQTAIQWLSQVHGSDVVIAGAGAEYPEADACFSRVPGRACAILTADCLPVLFCDRAGTVVAAAHAGWRGLLGGVLEATVSAMGVPGEDLLAWLGPAIGPGAFEIGPEVRSLFLEAEDAASRAAVGACFQVNPQRSEHFFANIYQLARLRLAGVGVGQVSGGEYCTFTDSQRFYSYRRNGTTGRMASLICLNPSR
ncbi:MAG: peptidoglycan editing factor PgeF [Halioglobus sp.]